jgi:hypothetical protein
MAGFGFGKPADMRRERPCADDRRRQSAAQDGLAATADGRSWGSFNRRRVTGRVLSFAQERERIFDRYRRYADRTIGRTAGTLIGPATAALCDLILEQRPHPAG